MELRSAQCMSSSTSAMGDSRAAASNGEASTSNIRRRRDPAWRERTSSLSAMVVFKRGWRSDASSSISGWSRSRLLVSPVFRSSALSTFAVPKKAPISCAHGANGCPLASALHWPRGARQPRASRYNCAPPPQARSPAPDPPNEEEGAPLPGLPLPRQTPNGRDLFLTPDERAGVSGDRRRFWRALPLPQADLYRLAA